MASAIARKKLAEANQNGEALSEDPFQLHTELEAARFFSERNRDNVRYCDCMGGWFIWDDRRWALEEDIPGGIMRLAKESAVAIADTAASLGENLSARADRSKFARNMQRARTIQAMLTLAESELQLHVSDHDWDSDQLLFNCWNGTIDLREGTLRPHRRADLLRKISPVVFDPEATCPRWEQFLDEIFCGNREIIEFMQRLIGYSLTGVTSEDAMFVLYGSGANGKSTMLHALQHIWGDYAETASSETFMARRERNARNDLARLAGARLVSAIELNEGRSLDESFVKSVTGGDVVVARFLFNEEFTFVPTFKLFLACNHRPNIRGDDYGIWRRIRLIPFEARFEEGDRDPKLREALIREAPGILGWAVQGCLEWQRNGLGTPWVVKAATDEYKTAMDSLSSFLDECCTQGPEKTVAKQDLFKTYRAWCDSNGEKPASQRWLSMRLKERGFKEGQRTKASRSWTGLGIADNG